MHNFELEKTIAAVSSRLLARRWRMATAESCTGGWVAKCCTDRPGSSAWFDRGYITYSYESKVELLAVEPELIVRHGAVSEVVARQMAVGACRSPHVQAALSITGIAGPDGGTADKPVGTVWFAWHADRGLPRTECRHFKGDRNSIRSATVMYALRGMVTYLDALKGA